MFKRWFSKRSQTEELLEAVVNTRSARIQISDGLRTAVAATDTPVPMFDFERMEVVDEILVASGGEFPERIPLLDTHDRSSVFKVFGSAINARMEGGSWLLDMDFDDDDESRRAEKKVANKHIRDVSIGYEVLERDFISAGKTESINGVSYTAGNRTLKVSHKWRGNELSLAPIGADRQAKIRTLLSLVKQNEPMKRNDELAAEFADLISETGIDRGEIVEDLTNATGLGSDQVESILSGEQTPDDEQISVFAAVLETEPNELQELV